MKFQRLEYPKNSVLKEAECKSILDHIIMGQNATETRSLKHSDHSMASPTFNPLKIKRFESITKKVKIMIVIAMFMLLDDIASSEVSLSIKQSFMVVRKRNSNSI